MLKKNAKETAEKLHIEKSDTHGVIKRVSGDVT